VFKVCLVNRWSIFPSNLYKWWKLQTHVTHRLKVCTIRRLLASLRFSPCSAHVLIGTGSELRIGRGIQRDLREWINPPPLFVRRSKARPLSCFWLMQKFVLGYPKAKDLFSPQVKTHLSFFYAMFPDPTQSIQSSHSHVWTLQIRKMVLTSKINTLIKILLSKTFKPLKRYCPFKSLFSPFSPTFKFVFFFL